MKQRTWNEALERELARIVLERDTIERQNLERHKKLPPRWREVIERGEGLLREAKKERNNTENAAFNSFSFLSMPGGSRERERKWEQVRQERTNKSSDTAETTYQNIEKTVA